MQMEASDEILVNRAQAGDALAFERLIERHYDLILRLGYRMLGSQSQAEDVTQDICCALPVKLQSFRHEAKFTTWLYRVSVNAIKDHLRKQKTRQSANQAWGDISALQTQSAKDHAEDLAWLAQAMQTLPDDIRETLVLILGEEMTHAEAAKVLDVSPGTISWRISEAKKRLRALAQSEDRDP